MSKATAVAPATPRGREPEPYRPGSAALDCLVVVAARHGLHLTIAQLVHDNALPGEDVSQAELVACAQRAGLKARGLAMDFAGLAHLDRALPAILRMRSGAHLILEAAEADGPTPGVVLRDPRAGDATMSVDRERFERAWGGEVVLVRRDYDEAAPEQPFSLKMILGLMLGQKRLVRDIVISAMVMSVLALAPIAFWRIVSDTVLSHDARSTFLVACVGLAIVAVFDTLFSFLRHYLLLLLTARVDVRLSEYMFDKVQRLPIDFFERSQVGLISRDMSEVWRIRTFLTGPLFGTLLDSLVLLVFIPVMFFYSPLLTFVVLGLGALIALWLIVLAPVHRARSNAVLQADGARGAFLIQSLFGMRAIKSLAIEDEQRRMWDVHVARVARLRVAEGTMLATIQAGVRPLERLAVVGSFAIGVYLAVTTKDPVYIGALFAFLMLSQRVIGPLAQAAQLMNQYSEIGVALRAASGLLNQPIEEGMRGGGVRTPLQGHVEFSGVRFSYPGANAPALDRVTFEVPIGATVGVVGRSGSGKTTVTRLLQRLHSDYQGLIKIDGVDVREYDVAHLRRNLGVVLQENFLFRGTIRENISAARSDATDDEIVRAARLAGAEEFIEQLPHGYDTFIYEGSPNLSGGQRQRIAIARALIVDPAILILDEATSALDPDSEAIVNANIKRIAQGRTTIVISHRLASLVNADAIVVLERGALVDVGKHEELLERCDIYASLWSQQNRHIDAAAPPRAALVRGPAHV